MTKFFTTIFLVGGLMAALSGQKIMDVNVVGSSILIPEEKMNTASFEFSPVFYGPYIAYVNDRGNSEKIDQTYNTPYFDLSFAGADTEGNLARQATFVSDISSEYQEGPFCFFANNTRLYFTRTDPQTGMLQIYSGHWDSGNWQYDGKVKINFTGHACHPTVSDDGKTMVFAGAPHGESKEDMDLYMARMEDNQWTNISPLPMPVNSAANDWFPRLVRDSILLFASERPDGFGGLDIFATKYIKGVWSEPELLGKPINSAGDDFGLVIGEEIAYFSSNRSGGKGKDDLYRIEFKGNLIFDPASEKEDVTLVVRNQLTLRSIGGAEVKFIPVVISKAAGSKQLFDIDPATGYTEDENWLLKIFPDPTQSSQVYKTEADGMIHADIHKMTSYVVEINAAGYDVYTAFFEVDKDGNEVTYVLQPDSEASAIEEQQTELFIPTTKGSIVVFENIYYDFNSYNIQAGAAAELDALADVMMDNPGMKVQLSAHTDSRGSRTYNQRLSERRAVSARNYLINKGIDRKRIVALGYGESLIRNHCTNNVKCTEEEHQYNRRTEVKILDN